MKKNKSEMIFRMISHVFNFLFLSLFSYIYVPQFYNLIISLFAFSPVASTVSQCFSVAVLGVNFATLFLYLDMILNSYYKGNKKSLIGKEDCEVMGKTVNLIYVILWCFWFFILH